MNEQAHGGLQLDEAITAVGESEASDIHNQWDTYPAAKQYVEMELGLATPKEPEFACPPLTVEDLTTPNSKEYTETYLKRVAWFGFCSERKAEHDAVVLGVEAEMSAIETRLRSQMRKNSSKMTRSGESKAPSAQAMEDAINSDVHYIELKKKLVYHKQILKHLNARCENLDREIRLTSRQVEIRRQDFDNTRGGQGVVRAPGPGMQQPRRW